MLSLFSCVQLCNSIGCSPPSFSVHGILQEYWSGLAYFPPRELPDQVLNPCLLCLLHWQVGSSPLVLPTCHKTNWLYMQIYPNIYVNIFSSGEIAPWLFFFFRCKRCFCDSFSIKYRVPLSWPETESVCLLEGKDKHSPSNHSKPQKKPILGSPSARSPPPRTMAQPSWGRRHKNLFRLSF